MENPEPSAHEAPTPSEEKPRRKMIQPNPGGKGPGPFGFILILLGVILLAQQVGNFSFHNWWALFILIPALSAFGSGFSMWLKDGRFHYGVFSTLWGGIFPLFVAIMFLFEMDWGVYWPVFIILGGFGMFLSGMPYSRPADVKVPPALLKHRPWPLFIGLSATLLGLTFLFGRMGMIDPADLIPFDNWWGVFVLLASLGGIVTAIMLYIGKHSNFLAMTNLVGGIIVALVGTIAVFDLDWRYMQYVTPIVLIGGGILLLIGVGRRDSGPES